MNIFNIFYYMEMREKVNQRKKQTNKLVFQWDSLYIFIIKKMSLPDYKMGEIQDGDITSQ